MSRIESTISKLGLELPDPAIPAGAYVPALFAGAHIYTSGQLPLVSGELVVRGKVGEDVDVETAGKAAEICTLNALAAIKAQVGNLDKVKRILKVTGFVASSPDFHSQPAVIDGASNLLKKIFGDDGSHVRSAVGVAVLPFDSPVEVELTVEVV